MLIKCLQGKSVILYIIFGILTTLINIVSYYICSHILSQEILISNVIAWIISVLFAYITNRKWVFESSTYKKRDILKEAISFFSCRLLTGLMDMGIMFISVNLLLFNDVVMKVVSNILVIVVNYIASKLLIFK